MTIWLKRSECKINFVGTVFSFIVIECRVCVCNMLQGHHNTLYALYEAMDRFFCFFYLHFIMFFSSIALHFTSPSLPFSASPPISVNRVEFVFRLLFSSSYSTFSSSSCFFFSFFFLALPLMLVHISWIHSSSPQLPQISFHISSTSSISPT